MTITPSEISNKDFKRGFRGYDMDEVDTFLDAIREDYEKIYKLNSTFKEQVIVLKEKVEHYTNMESTLQNTLVLAQTAAQQAKENSEKQAKIMIKEAEREADILIKEAEKRVSEINKEYEFTKQQFKAFKSRFRGMVESQLETIESIEIENRMSSVNTNKSDDKVDIKKALGISEEKAEEKKPHNVSVEKHETKKPINKKAEPFNNKQFVSDNTMEIAIPKSLEEKKLEAKINEERNKGNNENKKESKRDPKEKFKNNNKKPQKAEI